MQVKFEQNECGQQVRLEIHKINLRDNDNFTQITNEFFTQNDHQFYSQWLVALRVLKIYMTIF